jgi:hypothetical protein
MRANIQPQDWAPAREVEVTLQDLGNIGEFVGATGVVASLIYLALQIRQSSHQISENTNSVLGSVENEDARASSDFLQTLADSPALSRVWRLGHSEPSKLTEDESTQFVMLMGSAFYRLAGSFAQYRRGLLSVDSWEPYDRLISRYLQSPAVIEWWSRGDVPFARSFIDYVDARIPDSATRGAVSKEQILAPAWPENGGNNPE